MPVAQYNRVRSYRVKREFAGYLEGEIIDSRTVLRLEDLRSFHFEECLVEVRPEDKYTADAAHLDTYRHEKFPE